MSDLASRRLQLIRELDEQLAAAQRASGKSPEEILIEAMSLWWKQQKAIQAVDPIIQNPEIAGASQSPDHNAQKSVRVTINAPETLTKGGLPTLQRALPDRTPPDDETDQELEDAKRGITAKIKQLLNSNACYPREVLEISPEDVLRLQLNPDLQAKLQTIFRHRACIITGDKNVEKSPLARMALRIPSVPHTVRAGHGDNQQVSKT